MGAPGDLEKASTAGRRARPRFGWSVVSGGVIDTACAALANFVTAAYAVRTLYPAYLGIYAFWMAAYRLATTVPAQFVYVPSEIESLALQGNDRLRVMPGSFERALVPTLSSTLGIAMVAFRLTPSTEQSPLPLAVTAALASLVTAGQEHLRRVFHLAGHPYRASIVSFTCLLTAGLALVFNEALSDDPSWVPLGALALAYALSGFVGWLMAMHLQSAGDPVEVPWHRMQASGRPLLVAGMAPLIAGFATAALIGRMAGPAALGFAEAARVISRPVFVVVLGVGNGLRPRSMEAGRIRDYFSARRTSRRLQLLVLFATFAYLLGAGAAFPWNPFPLLFPTAYEVPWLVTLTVIAAGLDGVALPYRYELLGSHLERLYARVELLGSGLRTAIASASPWLQSFAMPIGLMALAMLRLIGYRRGLAEAYKTEITLDLRAASEARKSDRLQS